jgi:hypothetical protein
LEGWHENGEKDVKKKENTYVAEGRGDTIVTLRVEHIIVTTCHWKIACANSVTAAFDDEPRLQRSILSLSMKREFPPSNIHK